MKNIIYWIHGPTETDITTEGYIGVTQNLARRLRQHKWMEPDDEAAIVFTTDTIEEAYVLEARLRPHRDIGRNVAPGGKGGVSKEKTPEWKANISQAHKGKKHTPEHREANRQARLRASAQPDYKNPFAGRKHSTETKAKIAESTRQYQAEHGPNRA